MNIESGISFLRDFQFSISFGARRKCARGGPGRGESWTPRPRNWWCELRNVLLCSPIVLCDAEKRSSSKTCVIDLPLSRSLSPLSSLSSSSSPHRSPPAVRTYSRSQHPATWEPKRKRGWLYTGTDLSRACSSEVRKREKGSFHGWGFMSGG